MVVENDQDQSEDIFDEFLKTKGHTETKDWEKDHNKKKCPECYALHSLDATECTVCDWSE